MTKQTELERLQAAADTALAEAGAALAAAWAAEAAADAARAEEASAWEVARAARAAWDARTAAKKELEND